MGVGWGEVGLRGVRSGRVGGDALPGELGQKIGSRVVLGGGVRTPFHIRLKCYGTIARFQHSTTTADQCVCFLQ